MDIQKLNPEIFSQERLRKVVDDETYRLGENLFQERQVKIQDLSENHALCHVLDKRNHRVEIQLTKSHIYLKCNCTHASRGLVCEHGVASWLALGEHLKGNVFPEWRKQLDRMIDTAQAGNVEKTNLPYLLFFGLQTLGEVPYPYYQAIPYVLHLNSLAREIRTALIASSPQEIHHFLSETTGLVERLRIPPVMPQAEDCVNYGREAVVLANILVENMRSSTSELHLDDVLPLLANIHAHIYLGTAKHPLQKHLSFSNLGLEFRLRLSRDEQGVRVHPWLMHGEHETQIQKDSFTILHPSETWAVVGNQLATLSNPSAFHAMDEVIEFSELLIPAAQEKEFLDKYYFDLARQFSMDGEIVQWEEITSAPVPRLYLADSTGELQVQLRFAYGDYEVIHDSSYPKSSMLHPAESWSLVHIQRQPVEEDAIVKKLASASYGLKRAPLAMHPGIYRLRARIHPVDFLLHTVPRLVQEGFQVFGEEQLKNARVNRQTPSISFNVSSGIDWFDVQAIINFGELEVSLKDIRKSLRKNERFIKLADGSIGEIPESWLERFKYLLGMSEAGEKGFRLSQHHLSLIELSMSDADQLVTDEGYEQKRQALAALSQPGIERIPPVPLPQDFLGELRPYQKSGYDWLHFFRRYHFGGCLADDMGLGKTIQALVFLQSLYCSPVAADKPTQASLLVVPRSLLINWQREAARFAPNLKLMEYFASDRDKDFSRFNQVDVVITTYGVLLRDISQLHGYTFDTAILDESQAIKNPLSQTARAARLLQANHKLVLTGTPIENSTVELWSQFAFLNPGLLGSFEYFKSEFASPIERKNDEKALELLRRMVYPFILRRTKDQVAPELPPRSERILYCDMEPAQQKLYNRTRDFYRGFMLGMLDQGGQGTTSGYNPMKILEGLLRLRQISNHPMLFDHKFRGDSGKFALLFETLETLRAEGHKALVFSQFVQMLSLVRKELDARQVPYAYLDGKTQDRQAQVDLFQTDEKIPLFLISLRAGGLGLNLTAADYVIHIDPWWNPAVEMQASDRTHRIGQDKPVFVFKLITRDTVEEKILVLQERKKTLVDQVITSESAFFKNLTAEDLQVLFS